MNIIKANKHNLDNLKLILQNMNNEDYAKPLPILSNTSLSKHIRHIIDFYLVIINSQITHQVSYDHRGREVIIETSKEAALDTINHILTELNHIKDKPVILLQTIEDTTYEFNSTLLRELLYTLEHTIHHLAIIKIGIIEYFPYIELPKNFGVAYSTIAYQDH